MKLLLVLCAFALVCTKTEENDGVLSDTSTNRPDIRNFMVNVMIKHFIAYIRRVITKGSDLFGIPPLDPLILDHFHLNFSTNYVNLWLELKYISVTGFGRFIVHRSRLNLTDLWFDIDISVPHLNLTADEYDLVGDYITAIPVFGKRKAIFQIVDLRCQGKLYLKQSDDEKSILIDKIENATYQIPKLKSELNPTDGDEINKSFVDDALTSYMNRYHGDVVHTSSRGLVAIANRVLDQLDTWKYIAILL